MVERPITRAARKQETRQAILDAAAELFIWRGIDGASFDAIAARLGLTKGAVYGHFASKRELIEAVAGQLGMPADFTPLFRPDLSLTARLELFGEGVAKTLGGAHRDLVLLDFEYTVYAKRDVPWGKRWSEAARRRMRELGERFDQVNAERGERSPLPGAELMAMLAVVIRGLIQSLALDPTNFPASLGTFFALLAGPSTPAGAKAKSPKPSPRRKSRTRSRSA